MHEVGKLEKRGKICSIVTIIGGVTGKEDSYSVTNQAGTILFTNKVSLDKIWASDGTKSI